jgi:hypothetical protein
LGLAASTARMVNMGAMGAEGKGIFPDISRQLFDETC